MDMFNKGRLGKFLPIFLIAVVLISMLVYYAFASLQVNINSPPNATFVSNGTWLSTGARIGNGENANISLNCSGALEAPDLPTLHLYFSLVSASNFTFNQTNTSAFGQPANNTGYIFNVTNVPEGKYIWTCLAINSTGNVTRAGVNNTLFVDMTKPSPTYNQSSPSNGFNTTVTTLDFNWTATDNLAPVFYCNLTVDGVINNTGAAGNLPLAGNNGTIRNRQIANIPDGLHLWNVTCWDPTNLTGNTNTSATFTVTVDTKVPFVQVQNSLNSTATVNESISINFTRTDTTTLVSGAYYYLNGGSIAYLANVTTNLSVINITQSALNTIKLHVNDTLNNTNITTIYIYADLYAPHTVNLSGPLNRTNITTSSVIFNWTALDDLSQTFLCNFTLDGTVNATILAVNDTLATTTQNLPDGAHTWNVKCWDRTNATGHSNTTETRTITVDTTLPAVSVDTIAGTVLTPYATNYTLTTNVSVSINFTYSDASTQVSGCYYAVDGGSTVNLTGTIPSFCNNITGRVLNLSTNGLHTVKLFVNDTLNQTNITNIYIYVDLYAPNTINFSSTGVGSNLSNITGGQGNVSLLFTAIDDVAQTFLCNVTLDNVVNRTVLVVNNTETNISIARISDGQHNWSVTCWDRTNATGHWNNTVTQKFNVDIKPPVVTLGMSNATWFKTGSQIDLNATVVDTFPSTCDVWGQLNASTAGVHHLNVSNVPISYTSGAKNHLVALNLTEGTYTWNARCNHTSNLSQGASAANTTFYVDLTDPTSTITLSSTSIVLRGSVTITCDGTDAMTTAKGLSVTKEISSVVLPNNGASSADVDGSFTDTSVQGTYTATCMTTDASGRTTSSSATFSVGDELNTAGGSSGGGGGGQTTATASMSATVSATPESPAVIEVSNANIPVNEVQLEVTEAASNVRLSIQALASLPSTTTAPSGDVYKYLQITKSNLVDAKLKSAKIGFFVTQAWLTENGISDSQVVLKRYASGWQDLPTNIMKTESGNVYFEAETPGFSIFAIGVKPAAEEVPGEVPEEASEEAPAEVPEEAPAAPAAPAKASLTWLYVLIAAVVIGAVVAFVVMKKKK